MYSAVDTMSILFGFRSCPFLFPVLFYLLLSVYQLTSASGSKRFQPRTNASVCNTTDTFLLLAIEQ